MNLPPDPDKMNDDRAEWAGAAVSTFEQQVYLVPNCEPKQTILGDLLANLMHWCDRNGVDFNQALQVGREHYMEETTK